MVVGPYRGLYFADMRFLQQEHTQTALPDAAADGCRQLAVEQHGMEAECAPLLGIAHLQLLTQTLRAHAYAHGG